MGRVMETLTNSPVAELSTYLLTLVRREPGLSIGLTICMQVIAMGDSDEKQLPGKPQGLLTKTLS